MQTRVYDPGANIGRPTAACRLIPGIGSVVVVVAHSAATATAANAMAATANRNELLANPSESSIGKTARTLRVGSVKSSIGEPGIDAGQSIFGRDNLISINVKRWSILECFSAFAGNCVCPTSEAGREQGAGGNEVWKMAKQERDLDKGSRARYERALRSLQIELVKVQRHVIKHGHKALIIFEGRDASGKDGTIKRIVQHLSPRETRVVALGKPSDKDRASWYFQRYAPHLPAEHEMVVFNRSWYNRAGVEWVMEFCTNAERESFLRGVLPFEHMLIGSGIQIFKYYLDISKKEQRKRLRSRREDPLKQWKVSPIDHVALKYWDAYSQARDEMLQRTSSPLSPWIVVRADDKRTARLNVIRDLLARLACPDTEKHLATPDPSIVFAYDEAHAKAGRLAA